MMLSNNLSIHVEWYNCSHSLQNLVRYRESEGIPRASASKKGFVGIHIIGLFQIKVCLLAGLQDFTLSIRDTRPGVYPVIRVKYCCFSTCMDVCVFYHAGTVDQNWSILSALGLLPLEQRLVQSRGSNPNAGKIDQTWSTGTVSRDKDTTVKTQKNCALCFCYAVYQQIRCLCLIVSETVMEFFLMPSSSFSITISLQK